MAIMLNNPTNTALFNPFILSTSMCDFLIPAD
jgi:hypothetical protein